MIVRKWVYDALAMGVGSLSMALGVALFLLPNQVAAGGAPGVTVLISAFLDLSPGLILLMVNGSLMLLGLRAHGFSYLARTLVVVMLISGFTDMAIYFAKDFAPTDSRLLSAAYAGVFLGLGIGLIFRADASAGGWSILVQLAAGRFQVGIGQMAVIMDGTLVLFSMLVFKDFEAGLLGGGTVFITGRMIDWVLTEKPRVHLVNVYSEKAAELQKHIEDRFGIRGTLLQCDSPQAGRAKDLLHLSIDRRDLAVLKQTIAVWAPDAYATVTSTVDVMGVEQREKTK